MSIPLNNAAKVTVKGNKKPCLIYCNGDSVTANPNGYFKYVKNAAQAAAPVNATVVNAGTSGQGMTYFLANLETQVLQFNPDLITLAVLLNELGDMNVGDKITSYVNAVQAHTNPNGKKPILLLMTDNFCGQNIGEPYERTVTLQDACHTRLINAYSALADNINVFYCDPYLKFRALGIDTSELYLLLDSVHVHPNDAGAIVFIKAMQQGIFQSVFKFYNTP